MNSSPSDSIRLVAAELSGEHVTKKQRASFVHELLHVADRVARLEKVAVRALHLVNAPHGPTGDEEQRLEEAVTTYFFE
jgi:hypothetical protein